MKLKILLLSFLTFLLVAGNALATSFSDLNAGTNITITDTIWNSGYNGGSPALKQGGEDNETERTLGGVDAYTGQQWDLEGMFVNKQTGTLTIIGGANFIGGISFNGENIHTGDLFLGHFGTPAYSNGALPFNPAYAFKFDRNQSSGNLMASGSFTIFGPGVLGSLTSDITPLSDPYEYVSGGRGQGTFTYTAGLIDNNTGMPFDGWTLADHTTDNTHYYLQLSGFNQWNSIITSLDDIFHLTMTCGNDVIRGEGPVSAPEPGILLLLGSGLTALGVFGKRFKK